MATVFLPNAKAFLPSLPYASSSAVHAQTVCCRAATEASSSSSLVISRRTISLSALLFTTLRGYSKGRLDEANAAILEADDDEELLEKVKKDRKKRLERQGVISSSAKETAYLQDLVYKLSKVGQAIEKNDLSAATSVLGSSKDTEWVQKVNSAFNKLSSSDEEKTEVDMFNSSLASLISSGKALDGLPDEHSGYEKYKE
ncbi:UNVERIFIED_CONTAM: Thylakoid lumenal protein, chloroplastic [Sesamum latifolium]|uniref:Thylakoid lumenal protein, chloroplastic n=1 Tax=Sesamum latifolium TaxID=2727402 RepID=A0AAW2VD58_9LAMI